MSKYLNLSGLTYLWGKITALLSGKQDKIKTKTAAEWEETSDIPADGEIIVVKGEGIKIGDGESTADELVLVGDVDLSGKADKADTVLNTTLSRGRLAGSTVGEGSSAFGYNVTASGSYSHAEGSGTTALKFVSHAEGYYTNATDSYTHAEGMFTNATSTASHAEGANTRASTYASHAEGDHTFAQMAESHAEGYNTLAAGIASHAEGSGYSAFPMNLTGNANATTYNYTSTNSSISIYLKPGTYIAYENMVRKVTGVGNGTVTVETTLSSSTALSQASALLYIHYASGNSSHVEGYNNIASGNYSHAEGNLTKASDANSHAEGYQTIASGKASHAEGATSAATGFAAHVEGSTYVNPDTKTYVTISGNANATTYLFTYPTSPYMTLRVGYTLEYMGTTATVSSISGKNVTLSNTLSAASLSNVTVNIYHQRATGAVSHAEGSATATNSFAHAEGVDAIASGFGSHAEGNGTEATSSYAHAEGNVTDATGDYSHAEGLSTLASGTASHAEGCATQATSMYDHAEGNNTKASGSYSHSEGLTTIANGTASHAEGYGGTFTINGVSYTSGATQMANHSEGYTTLAGGNAPGMHSEGYYTIAGGSIPGDHAEGYNTQAIGGSSHAEGRNTIASGHTDHAEGYYTQAYSKYYDSSSVGAHSEGVYSRAYGNGAHAEGSHTDQQISFNNTAYYPGAYANGAHAEGINTLALGVSSHSEGNITIASGEQSHAEGYLSKATGSGAHSEGLHSIVTKSINGTTYYPGAHNAAAHNEGSNTFATGNTAHAEGSNTIASGSYAHAEGKDTIASNQSTHAEGQQTTASGTYSHAEGYGSTASDGTAHAEGYSTTASGYGSHSEGSGTTASGSYSHAEGTGTEADSSGSHAEGSNTHASSQGAHAEGSSTTASGNSSHAEGVQTIAQSTGSHSEGSHTEARESYSHAEGEYTIARCQSQHVSGKYNTDEILSLPEWTSETHYEIGDKVKRTTQYSIQGYVCNTANADISFSSSKWTSLRSNKYAEIVGNGTSSARSNARTLDWEGNAWYAGEVQVGNNNDYLAREKNFSNRYDATATYAVGDRCIYEGQLYRCTTAIDTAEAWTSAHWTAITVFDVSGSNIDGSVANNKLTLNIDTEIDVARTTTMLREDYSPDGSSWTDTVSNIIFSDGGYIEVEVDLSTVTGSRENIISIGGNIGSWTTSSTIGHYHLYYTPSDNFINCAACNNQAIHAPATVTPDSICTIKVDQTGLWVDGVQIIPKYTSRAYTEENASYETINAAVQNYITSATSIDVGSAEGSNRSHATYNYIKVLSVASSQVNQLQVNDVLLDVSTKAELADLTSLSKNLNTHINALQKAAIVATGNTHAAIASGQYVYVKNHSTLSTGMYVATAAVAANSALNSSNLTSDSNGILNSLKDEVTTLSSKMPFVLSGTTASTTGANAAISLPTGYTAENCCVGGFSVKNKNNSTWYSNVNAVTVYLSTGVQIQVSDAVWTSMPIKVWLIPL